MSERTAYPLSWPDGWKRTAPGFRASAKFSKYGAQLSIRDAVQRLIGELDRMGIPDRNVIVSTNVKPGLDGMPRSDARVPIDPGAAVYWRKNEKQLMRCMAIDRYTRVADNLAAIAATLEAMRVMATFEEFDFLLETIERLDADRS